MSILIRAIAALSLVVALGCGKKPDAASGPDKSSKTKRTGRTNLAPGEVEPKEKAFNWSKVGPTAQVGDIQLKVGAILQDAGPEDAFLGRLVQRHGPLTVINISATNTSVTKNVRMAPWDGATLTDENGNEYKYVREPRSEVLFPGKTTFAGGAFERVSPTAKELRITLPAPAIGGVGLIYLRAPAPK